MRAALALLLIACVGPIELKNAPLTVTVDVPRHDAKRHLMLRMEGISVEGDVAVWEVRAGDKVAGTLSTYGAQEQNGKFVAEVPVEAGNQRTLRVTFAPTARASGTIRIQRLRLVDQ